MRGRKRAFIPAILETAPIDESVLKIVVDHVSRQFAMRCRVCGVVHPSAREFIATVDHLGPPVSYDAEFGDWKPTRPIGAVGLSNCACGNTLAISSKGMPLRDIWKLLSWLRRESWLTGEPVTLVFSRLRRCVDERILAPLMEDGQAPMNCTDLPSPPRIGSRRRAIGSHRGRRMMT